MIRKRQITFWFFFLPFLAALLGQAGLAAALGRITLYRVLSLLVCIGGLAHASRLKKGAAPGFFSRILFASAASILFWLTLLEVVLQFQTLLARGALMFMAGAAFHAMILLFITDSRNKASRVGRLILRSSVFVFMIFFLTFLAESVIRMKVPLNLYEPIPDRPELGPYYDYLPDGRICGRPGFAGTWMHPEFSGVRFEINEYGFRDGLDEASPPQPGEVSMLVLGDSVAFGTGVNLEETFQERVEQQGRNLIKRPLRVYNASMPGRGQVHQWLDLKEWAPRLEPDIVVVALYEGNDFVDNLIAEVYLEQEWPCSVQVKESAPFRGTAFPRFLEGLESFLVALGLVRPLTPSNRMLTNMLESEVSSRAFHAVLKTFEYLHKIQEECQSCNADLVLLIIPAAIQAEPERFDEFIRYKQQERAIRPDPVSPETGPLLTKGGIPGGRHLISPGARGARRPSLLLSGRTLECERPRSGSRSLHSFARRAHRKKISLRRRLSSELARKPHTLLLP
ncbi:MAG: SGNH/GDSL hydrolase family protein [Planctomycetota bacterium]|jgi:hypothetical protein